MFTLSLCMIVKNESEVLERVLTAAKKFADEVIVVDTGSQDNTKDIAKKFTDKVFDFVWQDDFSKARNFAFSLGTCDYLMWLDADDVVNKVNIQKILDLKNSSKDADVFMCKYLLGIDQDGKPALSFYRERILKRSKNFIWQGFVHEAITTHGKVEYTDIEIEHHKVHVQDPKRNLRLYQKALVNGTKLNAREQYYYSRELFYNGMFEDAIKNFKIFLSIENTYPPDSLGAYLMLAECYEKLGQPLNGLDILFACFKKHPPNAEVCCKIGFIFQLLKETNSAIFWFKAALECPKQTEGFVNVDYQEFIPHLQLCQLLYSIDYKQSKKHHLKTKKLKPQHPSVLYNNQFFKK